MKRKWMVPMFIVVVAIGGFVIYNFMPRAIDTLQTQKPSDSEPFEPFDIGFALVGENDYDPAYYYANYDLIKDGYITDFRFVNGNEQFKELAEQGKFQKPASLDCDQYYCVVTYGREIVDLKVEAMNGDYYMPELTFDEEHHGNQVFIYQIDKIPYLYAFNWHCYMMQSEERVYLGDAFFDRNELDPEGTRK